MSRLDHELNEFTTQSRAMASALLDAEEADPSGATDSHPLPTPYDLDDRMDVTLEPPTRVPVPTLLGFATLLIGVSMVETLFTPVYGMVHRTRLGVYLCMDVLYRCYLLYSTHRPTLCKLSRYAPVRAHTTSACYYNDITTNNIYKIPCSSGSMV